ncbi:type III endosome membrane protein TEMP precursor, partial [Silurus meridionalis]
ATLDCSRRNLTSVPQQIWPNVTELDLSENHLKILPTKALIKLRHFDHLIKLNLSGNYLPLLAKQHFYHVPSLKILDLTGCKLAAVEPGALLSLPRLQKLLFEVKCNYICNSIASVLSMDNHSLFLRKLLSENLQTSKPNNRTGSEANDGKGSSHSMTWQYLVAALVTAISLSVLIAVGAKCKLFHRYLASYRHARLREGDRASQYDSANFEVGFSTSQIQPNIHNSDMANGNREDDDDGFIEDNYIPASERERAAREAEHWQEDDDDDIEE